MTQKQRSDRAINFVIRSDDVKFATFWRQENEEQKSPNSVILVESLPWRQIEYVSRGRRKFYELR